MMSQTILAARIYSKILAYLGKIILRENVALNFIFLHIVKMFVQIFALRLDALITFTFFCVPFLHICDISLYERAKVLKY